ncbi:MAG: hypothetical protein JXA71_10985 [Chitinispirillaceae bacterium]|nr:hypothetical protein [Chitinispirillaceae bacterium]
MNLRSSALITALLLGMLVASHAADPFATAIGWADVPGDNGIAGTTVQTTTGGAGGSVVTVTTAAELNTAIQSKKDYKPDPLVIRIRGVITYSSAMMNVNNVRNCTIEGEGAGATIRGFGFYVRRSQNLIIRNLSFENCPDDGLCLDYQELHHVWVDRCNFSDLPLGSPNNEAAATSDANNDGALDIKNGAGYITISFCRFENHSKTVLIGHDCTNDVDAGHLTVTVHHNLFGYVAQRATRNRYGKMHLFNNYYRETGTLLFPKLESDGTYHHGYAIASVCGANVVVENNYFQNVIWASLVSRNSEEDTTWLRLYGTIKNIPHWCPTSDEDPGFLSYRGENIQNPPPGTEVNVSGRQLWKILPLDRSNADPQGWNPWTTYGYSQEKMASVLHDAAEVPAFVLARLGMTAAVSQRPGSRVLSDAGTVSVAWYDLRGRLVSGSPDHRCPGRSLYLRKTVDGVRPVVAEGKRSVP